MSDFMRAAKLVQELEAAVDAARTLLDRLARAATPSTLDEVLRICGHATRTACGLTEDELHGRSRSSPCVEARQILVLLATEAGRSVTEISRYLGRDHSSIANLLKGGRKRRSCDAEFVAVYRRARSLAGDLPSADPNLDKLEPTS